MIHEETIKQILMQKPRYSNLIRRRIKLSSVDKIYTIIGPRRSGKSYFLYQIIEDLCSSGVDESQIVFINFEDERLDNITKNDLQRIIDIYYKMYPVNIERKVYFFLDEIHNAPSWSRFVRRLYDTYNCELYVTGSSAKMLSTEIATELRGRTWVYKIFPFSFPEYLDALGISISSKSAYTDERYQLIKYFEKYLETGGFPEVCMLDDYTRTVILQNYYDTVVFRDIIERYALSNTVLVKNTFHHLINIFARPFSANKWYNTLKSQHIKASKNLVYQLMNYIEDTLFLTFVPLYTSSPVKAMMNPKKPYIVDNGFILSMKQKMTKDKGWLYENLVARELIRRGYEIFYFKEKSECDFIVTHPTKKTIMPVQVSLEPEEPRELKGLLEAMKTTQAEQGLIITKNTAKEEIVDGKKVNYLPLWQWLLEG